MTEMTTVRLDRATLTYSPGWTVDTRRPQEDFAALIPGDDSYRVRLALTSQPSTLPIEEASDAELRALLAAVPGTHILACDPWLQEQGVPSRQYLYARPETGYSVLVRSVLWATGTHLVRLSLSSIAHQLTTTDPIFYAVATAMEVHR